MTRKTKTANGFLTPDTRFCPTDQIVGPPDGCFMLLVDPNWTAPLRADRPYPGYGPTALCLAKSDRVIDPGEDAPCWIAESWTVYATCGMDPWHELGRHDTLTEGVHAMLHQAAIDGLLTQR